jgi:hypothetical protein
LRHKASERIRQHRKSRQKAGNIASLKAGDVGPALLSQLPGGRRRSSASHALLRRSGPAIPHAAHGLHRECPGQDDPCRQRFRADHAPGSRITAPIELPDHRRPPRRVSHGAPTGLPRGSHETRVIKRATQRCRDAHESG